MFQHFVRHSFVLKYQSLILTLHTVNDWLPGLLLRLILAWEFGEAGWAKLHGQNWFADLQFPFPFDLLPAEVNWNIAMTFELVGAAALLLGLFTRFFSLSLMVLTVVAIASVHWPEHWSSMADLFNGYRFEDVEGDGFGNYKLPLIYLLMLLPLVTQGAGK
ncbi:DoxX family protein, partial [Methylophilus sp. OH31]|uniref:HvfX family Cu-binding RiPP maturation protein n=1 Tax=Methylophilus sp. OH31 TaxID=1387312 RepID=UPI0004B323E2